MNEIAICTDSSALLSVTAAASLGVEVVPIAVTLEGETFHELTSSLDWFYERLRAGLAATTSQPSPAEFTAAYERIAARGGRSVVSVHLDARVSGTVSSAELAARDAPIPVIVVDTRLVSWGVGRCVRAASEVVASGGSSGDAARAAARLGGKMRNAFVARGGPGGRIPAEASWMVLRYEDGAASRMWACASAAEAAERIAAHVVDRDDRIAAAVGHASVGVTAAADRLARRLDASELVTEVERYRVGASVGAHTGPDTFGAFWWPVE
jgi:DegV family protein with EDD domain